MERYKGEVWVGVMWYCEIIISLLGETLNRGQVWTNWREEGGQGVDHTPYMYARTHTHTHTHTHTLSKTRPGQAQALAS